MPVKGEHEDGRARFAELLGGLSLFGELADGFPAEKVARTCVIAVEVGRRAGLPDETLRDAYYTTLLHYMGCVGFSHEEAHVYGAGDDILTRNVMATADVTNPVATISAIVGRIGGASPGSLGDRARALGRLLTDKTAATQHAHAQCETSMWMARLVGVSERVVEALASTCERWDGKGGPNGRAAEALPVASRLMALADIVEIAFHRDGPDGAIAEAKRRAGKQLDPTLAAHFVAASGEIFARVGVVGAWDAFLAAEPTPHATIGPEVVDDVARALAHVADLKSPYFATHSSRVAEWASRAAEQAGLASRERVELRRAAFLHDVGRAGVPNCVWDKPGRLGPSEWERVRMHAYYTERILARAAPLSAAAAIAGAAHERLDGSGYHRGVPASLQGRAARILAISDALAAMTELRPHRPALSLDDAVDELGVAARAGTLDRDAVDAVVAAARGASTRPRAGSPRGLSDREVEVLRLVARGKSNREIGALLGISPRTVQNHVANVYDKLGVYSRAGATLLAVELGLME